MVIYDVPEGSTVVGIPAKAVRTKPSKRPGIPMGIHLDHHLIPDPVAGAIACLLDRIRLLERHVGVHGCLPGGTEAEDEVQTPLRQAACEPPRAAQATNAQHPRDGGRLTPWICSTSTARPCNSTSR